MADDHLRAPRNLSLNPNLPNPNRGAPSSYRAMSYRTHRAHQFNEQIRPTWYSPRKPPPQPQAHTPHLYHSKTLRLSSMNSITPPPFLPLSTASPPPSIPIRDLVPPTQLLIKCVDTLYIR